MIIAHPFNFPYEGTLNTQSTALIVIDMQVDFISQEGYLSRKGYDNTALRAIVPVVRELTDRARQSGCLVIWTRQGFRRDLADVSPYDRWRSERSGIPLQPGGDDTFLVGSRGHAIVPELEPRPGDVVIDKSANGAFYQTDLELVLKSRGISHLMFAGVTTDVCVHTTLREASDRKYQCLLVTDACASGDSYAHEAALHMVTVEDGVFGCVADSRAVNEGLGQSLTGE